MHPLLFGLIPTYYLVISLTFCLIIFLTVIRAKKLNFNINASLDILLVSMVSGFIGARVLHIIYEAPDYYIDNPLRVFEVWHGGFVYLGGVIAALIGSWIYCKYKNLVFLKWADFFAPLIAFGYGLGRFACFLNGCCYGKTCELPWAVRFPNLPHPLSQHLRHPTQVYTSLIEFCIVLVLLWVSSKTYFKAQYGRLFGLWLMLHGANRIFMESLRADFRGEMILGMSLSTLISLLLIFLGNGLLFLRPSKSTKS